MLRTSAPFLLHLFASFCNFVPQYIKPLWRVLAAVFCRSLFVTFMYHIYYASFHRLLKFGEETLLQ